MGAFLSCDMDFPDQSDREEPLDKVWRSSWEITSGAAAGEQ